MNDELSEREQAVLSFERQWWKYAGAKETAIREQFGCSATRYYQELRGIIEKPAALQRDPMLVKRLVRLQETRQARREGRAG